VGVSLKNKEKTIAIQQASMYEHTINGDWSTSEGKEGGHVMHEETKPRIEKGVV
jgi:hypothetical protein